MDRKRKIFLIIGFLFFSGTTLYSAKFPVRLDLYDGSDNHLMFVEFKYEGGRNTERVVYMSDSTFVRRVLIRYKDGSRKEEISYNFNEDTSFILTYKDNGFTLDNYINREGTKENRLDYVGGVVKWETSDNLNFNLYYKSDNSLAAMMNYQTDEEGNLVSVKIKDPLSGDEYTGRFTNEEVSVKEPFLVNWKSNFFEINRMGGGIIEFELNTAERRELRCEIIGLNGVKIKTLLKEGFNKGKHKRVLKIGGSGEKLPDGVYLLIFKVDGKIIMKSRYLHQNTGMMMRGGAR